MKQKFDITGMSCASCSAHVEKSVSKVAGVQEVQVNLLTNSMTVVYDDSVTSSGEIVSAVEKAGYGACPIQRQASSQAHSSLPVSREDPALKEQKEMKRRLIISLVFLIPLFYLSMGHMMGLPIPWFFQGEGKRSRIRLYPASAVSAHRVSEPSLFYRRLCRLVAPLP